jgi:hypothetical protein
VLSSSTDLNNTRSGFDITYGQRLRKVAVAYFPSSAGQTVAPLFLTASRHFFDLLFVLHSTGIILTSETDY